MTLRDDNLFKYATSELSQDAFICWLLSHAMESCWNKDQALTQCAVDFLRRVMKTSSTPRVSAIERQHSKIDVLVKADDKWIIIEDKTFTSTHDNQIPRYKQALIDEGIPAGDIICVFYKTVEQPWEESNVEYSFDRTEILSLLRPYAAKTENPLFHDYLESIENLEQIATSWHSLPIEEWNGNGIIYGNFFEHLIKDHIICDTDNYWWGYVANPSGGFQCLCWDPLNGEQLDAAGITEDIADKIKLQIENSKIAVKIDAAENANPEKIRRLRQAVYDHFRLVYGDEFSKPTWRPGRFMTVGSISYTSDNYQRAIELMESVMEDIPNSPQFKKTMEGN